MLLYARMDLRAVGSEVVRVDGIKKAPPNGRCCECEARGCTLLLFVDRMSRSPRDEVTRPAGTNLSVRPCVITIPE